VLCVTLHGTHGDASTAIPDSGGLGCVRIAIGAGFHLDTLGIRERLLMRNRVVLRPTVRYIWVFGRFLFLLRFMLFQC